AERGREEARAVEEVAARGHRVEDVGQGQPHRAQLDPARGDAVEYAAGHDEVRLGVVVEQGGAAPHHEHAAEERDRGRGRARDGFDGDGPVRTSAQPVISYAVRSVVSGMNLEGGSSMRVVRWVSLAVTAVVSSCLLAACGKSKSPVASTPTPAPTA